MGHDDWVYVVELVYVGHCGSVHSSTFETPCFLIHGRDPIMLIDRFMMIQVC